MSSEFRNEYQVERFHQQLRDSLKAVEKVLASNKASQLVVADKASHRYEDKYLLAEQLVGCGAAAVWNVLLALGLTEKQYAQFKEWRDQQRSVSLMAEFVSELFSVCMKRSRSRAMFAFTRSEVTPAGGSGMNSLRNCICCSSVIVIATSCSAISRHRAASLRASATICRASSMRIFTPDV